LPTANLAASRKPAFNRLAPRTRFALTRKMVRLSAHAVVSQLKRLLELCNFCILERCFFFGFDQSNP
jgi:hypothetical protein